MPQANQRVSEYVLDARVGGGAFGEVWRAHHHVWVDQLVAIKIPTDTQFLRNLQREGAVIHGMVHPNIVRAIGFDPYADPPYLTMEYVPGTSLRPFVKDRSLLPADAVAILRQVLAGLSYAHGRGLVHRDIKPENILIHERARKEGFNTEGVVKVTDFEFGKARNDLTSGSIVFSSSSENDTSREIAGSLEYMAPEQRTGGDVDGRADIYACGVLLYELLTGERPAGTDVPSDINPKAPKYLDEVFRRSYARLDKRYASADEFAKALAMPAPPPIGVNSQKPPVIQPPPMGSRPPVAPKGHSNDRLSCPQCRQGIDPTDQFCMHCGVQLVATVRRCAKCGAYPDAADKFCIFCGQTLTTEAMAT